MIRLKGELSPVSLATNYVDLIGASRREGRTITRPTDCHYSVPVNRCPKCGRLMTKLPCAICELENP